MRKISTVVVDDQKADRYIAKRELSKFQDFGEVIEVPSGKDFLDQYVNNHEFYNLIPPPILILMDINMPRMSGFDTVELMQSKLSDDQCNNSIVIMMFTSSDNPHDKERAENLNIVKGYITKPIDSGDIDYILKHYKS